MALGPEQDPLKKVPAAIPSVSSAFDAVMALL